MGVILALDYGDKRIGVAVSDAMRILAGSHSVIENKSHDIVINALKKICEEEQAEKILLGLPLNMDGSEGPAVKKVRSFAAKLQNALALPIAFWDERLSTEEAQGILTQLKATKKKRKKNKDILAARIILQNYLDAGSPEHGIQ